MLLVYYNPTRDKFYLKYYKYINQDYFIGYINQFNHEVVKIYIIEGKELVSVNNVKDYMLERYKKNRNKKSVKHMLINRLIGLLNKLD